MFGKRKTKLYFAPHQDDELLSMGVDLCASLDKGEDVHVFLCTDGSQSKVRLRLNNGQKCPKHPGIHQYALTLEEFSQARDREFMDSCLALGVAPGNIHILPQRAVDGSLAPERAARIIRDALKEYGDDVQVCTLGTTGHWELRRMIWCGRVLFGKQNFLWSRICMRKSGKIPV